MTPTWATDAYDRRRHAVAGFSLLLWEGRSLTYVAEQDGHSVATLARHYAGTIAELEDQPRVPAAQAILEARAQVAAGERTNAQA